MDPSLSFTSITSLLIHLKEQETGNYWIKPSECTWKIISNSNKKIFTKKNTKKKKHKKNPLVLYQNIGKWIDIKLKMFRLQVLMILLFILLF